ncbi:MAG TPA: hypothetical protein VFA65_12255 [Bryobacteraceae bacterium]|nr:hypothetical protein [Bryobacteraceae bacterium]
MADDNLAGFWKGVAVSRLFQVVIYVFLDGTDQNLTGRFEAQEPSGQSRDGKVTGTFEGERVSFTDDSGSRFIGTVVGEGSQRMIYGTLQGPTDQFPTGTLTLFSAKTELFASHYTP